MDKINIEQVDTINNYAEIINLDTNNLVETNSNSKIKKIIINFPFRKLYYLGKNLNIIYINENFTFKFPYWMS